MNARRRPAVAQARASEVDALALGERLRGLRTARGLTLGQVAHPRFSAAFLSQIERGLARPSPSNLEHIAERLGADVETLLRETPSAGDRDVAQLRLVEARAALAREEAADALRALDGLPATMAEADRLERDLLEADALVRLGRYEEGLDRLDSVQRQPRAGTAEIRLRAAEVAARANYRRLRYHLALEALRQAQDGLDEVSVDPMTRARFLAARAACHMAMGNERAAVGDYEAALDASGNVADLAELGRIYNGLNLAHQALGNLDEALTYARRSAQIFEVLQNGRNVGRTHHSMGELLVRQERLVEARDAFRRALTAFETVNAWGFMSYTLESLARLDLDRGHIDEAETAAARATELAANADDPVAVADAARLRGDIAALRGDLTEAEARLREAVAAYEASGSGQRLGETCYALSQVLHRKGDDATALTFAQRAYEVRRDDARRD